MHRCIKQLVSILLCSVLYTPALWANGDYALHNESFSSFELGSQSISYAEQITFFGIKLKSRTTASNTSHRLDGYSASDARSGLYITSIATLLSDTTTEDWEVVGQGPVLDNDLYFSWNELNINRSYLFHPGHQWLYGLRHLNLLFTRYDQVAINSGSITVAAAPGSITETITDFYLQGGYRYDSFFDGNHKGPRLRFTALLGMPAYTKVTNTNHPDSIFNSNFDGYMATVNASVAWTMFKSTQLMLSVQGDYRYHETIAANNPEVVIAAIPENTTLSIFSTLGVVWFF